MNFLSKKPVAALIMSLVISASLILIARTPAVEALIVCGILLAVCILVDLVAGAKALTKMQSRLAAIAIGGTAIVGIVIFGVATGLAMPDPDVASSPSPSASQNAESPTNTSPETTEGDEKPTDEIYELGLFYYEREEYEKAIQTLDKVKETSDYYVDAVKLRAEAANAYRSSLTDTAKPYVDKGNYKLAIDILNAGLLVIPKDAELLQTIETYSLEYANLVRTAAITEAETFAAAQDYANALVTIQGAIDEVGSDVELKALCDKYAAEYRNNILTQSAALLYSEGYESAIQLIQSAMSVLPDDREISDTIAEYEEYAPIYLIEDIDYLRKDDRDFGGKLEIGNDALTDNDGNTIIGHYHFHNTMTRNWATSDHAFITFDLSSQFKSFSGTLVLPEEHKHTGYSAFVYVYGDDKLLYTSPPITAGFHTENFIVEISGVSTLKIEMANDSGIGSDYVVGYLTNAYLSKLAIPADETAG